MKDTVGIRGNSMIDFDFYEGKRYMIDNVLCLEEMMRSQRWYDRFAVLEDVYYKDGALEFRISARNIWPSVEVYDHDDEILEKFRELAFGRLMTYSNILKYYIEAAIEVFNRHDIGVDIGDGVAKRVGALKEQYLESITEPSHLREHMLCR